MHTKSPSKKSPASRTAGSQTLTRGLRVLRFVAESPDGQSIQEVADLMGIHRTIAYRILNAICDSGFIVRSEDGRYRAAAGLVDLASNAYSGLRAAAMPILTALASELGSSVSLLVREGEEAVALAVVQPPIATHLLSFRQGSRTRLDVGCAAYALRSLDPASESDSEEVLNARRLGYSRTFSEVEPNMYGLAVPVFGLPSYTKASINIITNRHDVVESATDQLRKAANQLSEAMSSTTHV